MNVKLTPESIIDENTGRSRVRCPLCAWIPDGRPRWMCEKCGAQFDTFKTRAHCPDPDCGNSWRETQCPMCHEFSPHEEWYAAEEF